MGLTDCCRKTKSVIKLNLKFAEKKVDFVKFIAVSYANITWQTSLLPVVTMINLKGKEPANCGIARHSMTVSLWRHVSGVSASRVTPGDWRKGGGDVLEGRSGINKTVSDAKVGILASC